MYACVPVCLCVRAHTPVPAYVSTCVCLCVRSETKDKQLCFNGAGREIVRLLVGKTDAFVSRDYVLKAFTASEWLAGTKPCATQGAPPNCKEDLKAGVKDADCDTPTFEDLKCMVDKAGLADKLASGTLYWGYDELKARKFYLDPTNADHDPPLDATCGQESEDGSVTMETADFQA